MCCYCRVWVGVCQVRCLLTLCVFVLPCVCVGVCFGCGWVWVSWVGFSGFCVGVVGCWLGWCLVVVPADVPGGFAFWVGADASGCGGCGFVEAFVWVGSLVCCVGEVD